MNKPNQTKNRNKHIGQRTDQWLPEGKGLAGQGEMGKEDQLYGYRWKLNFWW